MTENEKSKLRLNLVEELIKLVEFVGIDQVTPDTPIYRCFDAMKKCAEKYRSEIL